MFVCALLGAIAYYLITLLVHHFTGIQFASYAGANSLSKTTVLDIKIAIASSYQKFYELFMNFMGIKSTSFLRSSYIFYLISSCVLVSLLLLIINEKIYKNPLRLLILFGTLVIYPFVNGIILIVVKYHGIHNLMIQSYYIIFLLFASIIDICQNKECKIKWLNAFVISFVFSVLMVIFAFEHLAINNATYEYFNIKRNKMVSIANRILEKAENLPDYCEECKFAFAGSLDSSYPIESYLSNLSFSEENILEPADYFQNKAVIENIYREDVGCYINICDDDTYTNIVNSKEYSDMPVYPKNGSIQMIDDIIVVKLSDDIFLP